MPELLVPLTTVHIKNFLPCLIDRWRRWATSPECERDFPTIRSVSLFQRVLLVQALRPDRLQSALHQFASEVLRVTSLSPPAQSLEQLYQQEASGVLFR